MSHERTFKEHRLSPLRIKDHEPCLAAEIVFLDVAEACSWPDWCTNCALSHLILYKTVSDNDEKRMNIYLGDCGDIGNDMHEIGQYRGPTICLKTCRNSTDTHEDAFWHRWWQWLTAHAFKGLKFLVMCSLIRVLGTECLRKWIKNGMVCSKTYKSTRTKNRNLNIFGREHGRDKNNKIVLVWSGKERRFSGDKEGFVDEEK